MSTDQPEALCTLCHRPASALVHAAYGQGFGVSVFFGAHLFRVRNDASAVMALYAR